LPSRTRCGAACAAGVRLELAVDGVADLALAGAEGFLAGLAFGSFLVVVGAAVAVPVADLGDRGHVDGVVHPAVAAPGEPEDGPPAGRGLDRCGAVVGGEVVAVGEPGDVGDVADDGGGDHRADAEELGQGGARGPDRGGDLSAGLPQLGVEAAQVVEVFEFVAGRSGRPGRDDGGE